MIKHDREAQQMIPTSEILIIGLGGAGANIIDRVIIEGLKGPEILAINSDIRTLQSTSAKSKIQLGTHITKGLGSGGDPESGKKSAEESEQDIRAAIKGRKIVFLCVGLGGGTGSGASPLISRIAREEGAFTVVFATMPFSFEGARRRSQAETALNELAVMANALITFDNGRMSDLVLADQGIHDAFDAANRLISDSIHSIARISLNPGIVHIGLDDLVTTLSSNRSRCIFGSGKAGKEDRAVKALEKALKSPLLDEGKLMKTVESVLVHICGGPSLKIFEAELMMNELTKYVNPAAQVFFGVSVDETLGGDFSVTIISSLPEEDILVPVEEKKKAEIDFSNKKAETPTPSVSPKADPASAPAPASTPSVTEKASLQPSPTVAATTVSTPEPPAQKEFVPTPTEIPKQKEESAVIEKKEEPVSPVVEKKDPTPPPAEPVVEGQVPTPPATEEKVLPREEKTPALSPPTNKIVQTPAETLTTEPIVEKETPVSETPPTEPAPQEQDTTAEKKEDALLEETPAPRRRFGHLFGKEEEPTGNELPETSAVESEAEKKSSLPVKKRTWKDFVSAPLPEQNERDLEITPQQQDPAPLEKSEAPVVAKRPTPPESLSHTPDQPENIALPEQVPFQQPLKTKKSPVLHNFLTKEKPLPVEKNSEPKLRTAPVTPSPDVPSIDELASPPAPEAPPAPEKYAAPIPEAAPTPEAPPVKEIPAVPAKPQKTTSRKPTPPTDAFSQGELQLDGQPKGRFEGESPNIFEGEDLDIPTFLRDIK